MIARKASQLRRRSINDASSSIRDKAIIVAIATTCSLSPPSSSRSSSSRPTSTPSIPSTGCQHRGMVDASGSPGDSSDAESTAKTSNALKKGRGGRPKKKIQSRTSTPPPMDPKDIQAMFQSLASEADKLVTSGYYAEAIVRYTRALELHPDDPDCLVSRSRCHMMLGDNRAALADADRSLVKDPTFIRGIFQKAESLYSRGDFETALVLYHRGHRARPELQGFHVGVHKCTEAIRSAVELLDPAKLRERRAKMKIQAANAAVHSTRTSSAAVTNRSDDIVIPSFMSDKEKHERNLLEELYDDKAFLEDLARDEGFMRAADGAVRELVHDGLKYIRGRSNFWRQRNPCGKKLATTVIY